VTIIHIALLLLLPPLLPGVIGKTKAWFSGRTGPPLLQTYFDLSKLLHKGVVSPRTTTWLFHMGPVVSLSALLTAGLLMPLGMGPAPLSFHGDLFAFAALLGLARFTLMLAAMDTGSSLEGIGASRKTYLTVLSEPALFLALLIVAVPASSLSFERIFSTWTSGAGQGNPYAEIIIAALVLFCLLLEENARVPFSDPAHSSELTTIQEVMAIDHSGPDLAFILYGNVIKLFLFSALVVQVAIPHPTKNPTGALVLFCGTLVLSVLIGLIESVKTRLRLSEIPQLLIGASAVAAIGLLAVFFRGPWQ
jgi:formate hydrogenlyase subunit 4